LQKEAEQRNLLENSIYAADAEFDEQTGKKIFYYYY
jgi:hypothetical protein